jgi:hypothetical protein
MLFSSNQSCFYYEDNFGVINDYYQYIVELIKLILTNNPSIAVNIRLCNKYKFNNDNKVLSIEINWEHTLVKQGGRSVRAGTPIGNIKDINNNSYFVRIERYEELNSADLIIDYSNPNIYNVKTLDIYKSFSIKHFYVSPSIYENYIQKENRSLTLLTTFINTMEPRRQTLLRKIKDSKIDHSNISDCFNKNKLRELYKKTKILVNVHQTDHHDTFEELRSLPALQCGVIVISEDSPLKDRIPYHSLVIWAKYDEIISKLKEVSDNYEIFFNLIFSDENLTLLKNFHNKNIDDISERIISSFHLNSDKHY